MGWVGKETYLLQTRRKGIGSVSLIASATSPISKLPHTVLKMLSEECIELLFNFCCLCARDCFCPFSVLRCVSQLAELT